MSKSAFIHLRYFLVFCGLLFLPALLMVFVQENSFDYSSLIFTTFSLGFTGILGDIWATRQGKRDKLWIWAFSRRTLTGSKLLGHPLEEYFFFIAATPYVILFWELLNSVVRKPDKASIVVGLIVLVWVHAGAIILYRLHTRRARRRHNV